ncbi:MAG: arsenate reductase ArsC [Pseudomonadota bacterium]
MERVYNILFLCTGNSARSVMAEGLVNLLGKGRFRAFSAGSRPVGRVNPLAIEQLARVGYDASGARSKSWDEFAQPDAPPMDFIVTVCGSAAGEVCPVWPGHPATAHWGFDDPAAVEGSEEQKRAAFHRVFGEIRQRVQLFLALPVEKLDRLALLQQLREIGETRPT